MYTHGEEAIYEAFCRPTGTRRPDLWRGDYQDWFQAVKHRYHVQHRIFSTPERNALVQCERCVRLYDQRLNIIHPLPGRQYFEPILQMPFTFCPANRLGKCHQQPMPSWIQRQERIASHYDATAQDTIDYLSRADPQVLMRNAFGVDMRGCLAEEEIIGAYKALRILYIRSFKAHQKSHLEANEENQGQLAVKCDHLSLWGDISYDLSLMAQSHISGEDISYLYGVSEKALQFLSDNNWLHEMAWLNAYAGMRHRVDNDHFMLMRTACQRVSTAMDRILQATATGALLRPGSEKQYAMNGQRFHELLGAICVDLTALRMGRRSFDNPLHVSWWRDRTTTVNGVHLDLNLLVQPLPNNHVQTPAST